MMDRVSVCEIVGHRYGDKNRYRFVISAEQFSDGTLAVRRNDYDADTAEYMGGHTFCWSETPHGAFELSRLIKTACEWPLAFLDCARLLGADGAVWCPSTTCWLPLTCDALDYHSIDYERPCKF